MLPANLGVGADMRAAMVAIGSFPSSVVSHEYGAVSLAFPAERPPSAVEAGAQVRLRYLKEKQMRQNIIVASVIALVTVIAAVWGTIIVEHAPKQPAASAASSIGGAADDEECAETSRGKIRRALS